MYQFVQLALKQCKIKKVKCWISTQAKQIINYHGECLHHISIGASHNSHANCYAFKKEEIPFDLKKKLQ